MDPNSNEGLTFPDDEINCVNEISNAQTSGGRNK